MFSYKGNDNHNILLLYSLQNVYIISLEGHTNGYIADRVKTIIFISFFFKFRLMIGKQVKVKFL